MRLTLTSAAFALVATAAFAQVTPSTTTPGATTPTGAASAPSTATTLGGPAGIRAPAATVNQNAQTTNSPNASAVQTNNTTSRTAAAPVPGRNSFTAGEARRRITSAGFTNVSGLKKDGQGIWRGQAQKDGATVGVALDYQGNVVGQ